MSLMAPERVDTDILKWTGTGARLIQTGLGLREVLDDQETVTSGPSGDITAGISESEFCKLTARTDDDVASLKSSSWEWKAGKMHRLAPADHGSHWILSRV